MKKILTVSVITMIFSFFSIDNMIHAEEVYEIKRGDTLWLIGKKHGVSMRDIESVNQISGNFMFNGEKLIIPSSLSEQDMGLLARIVHAEAKGEPYKGKVAVATVVLNRVKHEQFPDSIEEVIYQENAFEPVANGSIHEPADEASKKAVQEALAYQMEESDLVYFYNPDIATSDWIFSREVTMTIGNHVFAR
ncbi:cell wall hydrolase [Metabacillus arenae]|uniref:Cell wall hydrolase n=1 Tax=Metabacillus arenae TaxID=2771434 RepID=A0A926S0V6_9BACI|nr:cell wall hydrolase [Metabacillus arenae]MBD1380404.1 cell wall hydrolase [Metabacillus arenae]